MKNFKTKIYFLLKRNSLFNVFAFAVLLIKKVFKKDFKAPAPKNITIDLVITTIEKDFEILDLCIDSAIKNINHKINKVFIISNESVRDYCNENNFIFINEIDLIGYSKKEINYNFGELNRSGWLYQQLLKLSADKIIEKDNFLVLDSDTIMLNKHSFIDQKEKFVFYMSEEWNKNYFETYKKIFKEKPVSRLSFVSHMMIFNKEILKSFKKDIEDKNNKKWDQVIINNINRESMSFFSEYESYGNWCLKNKKNKVNMIPTYNRSLELSQLKDYDQLKSKYNKKYNSISFHNYANK